ncbi:MAG: hypothetical protein ACYTAF_15835, partial [Planctomycetota bacterium]
MANLRDRLRIPDKHVREINDFLLDPKNEVVNAVIKLVEKFGGPEAINKKAKEARDLKRLMGRLKESGSPYFKDVEWLIEQRDRDAFVSIAEYRHRILGDGAKSTKFNEENAVTLEISAYQYFPWLIAEAREAIAKKQRMPGRFIRVRNMKEQVGDNA